MIPSSWLPHTRAAYYRILVDRQTLPDRSGLILLSPHLREHTRTSLATIVDIHPACGKTAYQIGDFVMLAASSGVRIIFGYGKSEEEQELWSFPPTAVKLIFREAPTKAVDHGADILRNERMEQARQGTVDLTHLEGESEALR